MSSDATQLLSDPGGVRPLVARWTIETDLLLESAAHFGGGSGDGTDMVVLRDARTGGPLLPGTSLAGALRSHLADVLGGYRTEEPGRVADLFGAARRDDVGQQSPLIVFDSLGVLQKDYGVEIRDGVQIDSARGTAEEHKKFDLEVLPAETTFPLRFDLLVPARDQEAELLSLLVTALAGLSAGDIAFGARRSRGLGMARAQSWWAVRYDLSSQAGWMKWLLSDHTGSIRRGSGAPTAAHACKNAWPELVLEECPDLRRRVVADVELRLKGPMLIRSVPLGPDSPDAAHMQSAGRSVLPGTSLAGVLRSQALRVARVVRQVQGDAEHWVEQLFGPRMAGTTRRDSAPLRASRLRIAEAVIEGGTRTRPTRVRIDRFTQGVVPGALFDEEIEGQGRARVRMELRDPCPGELGLLVLLLKDLLSGNLAVGGTASVGRGFLEGTVDLRLQDGKAVQLHPGRPADPCIERAVEEFWSAPASEGDVT